MYAVDRAYFTAFTAGYALVVINSGEIIYQGYRALGAGLNALAAGYTSVSAELSDLGALVMIVTFYYDTGSVLDKMNNTVGAGTCAKTASDTAAGVNFCNSLFGIDAYRVAGTNGSAVTVAKAGKIAKSVTGKALICSLAALWAVVNILTLLG